MMKIETGLLFLGLLFVALLNFGCDEEGYSFAEAYEITNRGQLIGGEKALGNLGDYMIENDRIRVIINGHPTDMSGGGVNKWGGAIIDADIQRPERFHAPAESGHDKFLELMPAFDIKTFGVENLYGASPIVTMPQDAVEILPKGEDGSAAVKVTGVLQSLLALIKLFPASLSSLPVRAETIYRLAPGSNALEITTHYTLLNADGSEPETINDVEVVGLTKEDNPVFSVLSGDVLGDGVFYGSSLDIIGPGMFGFSAAMYVRSLLLDEKKSTISSPPMLDWSAGVAKEVGYGIVAKDAPLSFPVMEDFLTLAFHHINHDASRFRAPGDRYSYSRHFLVDEGDVGGILDHVIDIKGWSSGRLKGHVVSLADGKGVSDAFVHICPHPYFTDNETLVEVKPTYEEMNAYLAQLEEPVSHKRLVPYSRLRTDGLRLDSAKDGSFSGRLPVDEENGYRHYIVFATGRGHSRSALVPIVIGADQTEEILLGLPATGEVQIDVRSLAIAVGREPCKITVVSPSGEHLPDPYLGEGYFPSNIVALAHPTDGKASFDLLPGNYRVIANRGYEYSADERMVTVRPLETLSINMAIDRVVDTSGWVAGDLHMHTNASPDSGVQVADRVRYILAEGLDFAVSTDHDVIRNYRPEMEKINAWDKLRFFPGDELSNFSYGHFNAFPLVHDELAISGGAPQWRNPSPTTKMPDGSVMPEYTPQDCFDALRSRGDASRVDQAPVVIANHTQESFTGYFRTFGFYQYYGDFGAPDMLGIANPVVYNGDLFVEDARANFSWDFDAIEVINPTAPNDLRTATMEEISPEGTPLDELADILHTLYRTADEQMRIASGDLRLEESERGMLDDYLTLLVMGKRPAGVGVSDSHSPTNENGKGRTYVQLSTDDPRFIDENELLTNLKAAKVTASQGPFMEMWINDEPIGSDVAATGEQVQVRLRVQATPWLTFHRIELYGNGVLVGEIGRESSGEFLGCHTEGLQIELPPNVVRFDETFSCDVSEDTVFVAVGLGFDGMEPYMMPNEFPGVLNMDSLMIGFNDMLEEWVGLSDILPMMQMISPVHPFYPYAVTNAIWVDTNGGDQDGDGYLYDSPARNADGSFKTPVIAGWFNDDPKENPMRANRRRLQSEHALEITGVRMKLQSMGLIGFGR